MATVSPALLVLGAMAILVLGLAVLVQHARARRLRAALGDARWNEAALRQIATQARERADAGEQAMTALMASMPEPRLVVDARGTIVEANLPAARLLRKAQASLPGTALAEVLAMPELDQAGAIVSLMGALARIAAPSGPLSDRVLIDAVDPEGRGINLELVLCRYHWKGARAALIACRDLGPLHEARRRAHALQQALDATAQAHARDLAQAREQAERATRTKQEFLATLSHELRTPLHAILGLAHLVRAETSAQGSVHLDRLDEAARHLLELLTDLLAIAEASGDAQAADAPVLDIEPLVIHACRSAAEAATRQGIALVPWIDTTGTARVHAHGDRLRRVLKKLIGNAIRFTPSGHVTVRVRIDGASASSGEPRLRVEVSDTGIGMPSELVARLGQPFERAGDAMARATQGTGIGLALARRLLATMGAQLTLHSQPGRGTTASFDLRAATEPADRTDDHPAAHGGVLVLDPLDDARAAHAAHLARMGWQVWTASTPGDALLALRHAQQSGAPIGHGIVDDRLEPAARAALLDGLQALRGDAPALLLLRQPGGAGSQAPGAIPSGFAAVIESPVEPAALSRRLQALTRPAEPTERGSPGTLRSIDVTATLLRLRGRPEHLLRLMQHFHARHGADLEHLAQAQHAGDAAGIRTLATALHGAAATLGAAPLAQAAAAVAADDDAWADPAAVEALRHALSQVLDEVAHSRPSLVPAEPMSPVTVPSAGPAAAATCRGAPDAAHAALDELLSCLPQRDMAVVRLARRHATALVGCYGQPAQAAIQALEDFDYDLAATWLERCTGAQGAAAVETTR